MRAVAVSLLVEEQRGEIVGAWRDDVERELGGEPALAFAVGPLLREMALALRDEPSPFRGAAGPAAAAAEAGARSAVLVRSGAGPARIAREFKLLHRALWMALKRAGAVLSADERRAGDEWLDEALAVALDRQDRVRTRAELLEPSSPTHAVAAPAPARLTPPPLPPRAAPEPARRAPPPPVVAARPPPLPAAPRPPPLLSPELVGVE